MRLATLTLAMLGLLCVGTTFAEAQEVVTPVVPYAYTPSPGGYAYYGYPPSYTYGQRSYWYGRPRYYDYYATPYPGYYYPNGFGFEYRGPRRSFSFGF